MRLHFHFCFSIMVLFLSFLFFFLFLSFIFPPSFHFFFFFFSLFDINNITGKYFPLVFSFAPVSLLFIERYTYSELLRIEREKPVTPANPKEVDDDEPETSQLHFKNDPDGEEDDGEQRGRVEPPLKESKGRMD